MLAFAPLGFLSPDLLEAWMDTRGCVGAFTVGASAHPA